MSAQLTKQFGMAPGGEFRAAFRQVKSLFSRPNLSSISSGSKSSQL